MEASFKIKGISPLLMHCGQTADPVNCFSRAMKNQSKKRNKTDDDYISLANLEWFAGLYTTPRITTDIDGNVTIPDGAKLIIPAHVLDSCIREGAKKNKEGKLASAGVIVTGDGEIITDAKSVKAASQDEAFRFSAAVRVGTAKVIRTRPRFDAWEINFTAEIDESVCEVRQVTSWLQSAGKLVGIGDWRPGAPHGGSFGRFIVV
jgi:hypothetical protein